MAKAKRPLFFMLVMSALAILFVLIMQPLQIIHYRDYIAMLFPKGAIALEERNLLFIIQGIMLLVVIPVYILTFIFSWIYRENNPKGVYDPDLVDNVAAEYLWWGIPLVLTAIVAGLTWVKTYELDPYKPIAGKHKPMTVQVVALQWKWLFIYPEDKIAVVNFLQIPVDTPVHFEITADAPMNSFWIPHLGGQIYAMPGMQTELHLIANQTGDFRGSSANLSGEGFSGMHFITRASSVEEYEKWREEAKKANKEIDYQQLAKPSQNNAVEIYQLKDAMLFHKILHKYMHPEKI